MSTPIIWSGHANANCAPKCCHASKFQSPDCRHYNVKQGHGQNIPHRIHQKHAISSFFPRMRRLIPFPGWRSTRFPTRYPLPPIKPSGSAHAQPGSCLCCPECICPCSQQIYGQTVKKVKASHTRYRALGPELIPMYRQSACR